MALWYFFTYAALALVMPFVPVFLKERGFTYTQIGLLAATAALAGFFTQNAVGAWSDRWGRRKPFILFGSLAMAGLYSLFPYLYRFNAFVFVYLLSGLASYTALTVGSAMVLDLAPPGEAGHIFARTRIWGSVGFVAMMALGWAAPQVLSSAMLFRATPLLYLGGALSVLTFPEPRAHAARASKPPFWEGLSLLREPGIPVLLLVTLLLQGSLNGVSSSLVLWMKTLHTDQRIVHLAFVVSATIEIPFMIGVGRWSDRYGRRPLLAITGIALPIRLLLYSLIVNPQWIPAVQLMHGLTFSVLSVVPLAYMNDVTPENRRAAGQGLLNATMAGASAFGPLLAGGLGDLLGLRLMYRALAFPAAAGGVLLFLFLRESHPASLSTLDALPKTARRLSRPIAEFFDRSPLHK